MKKEYDDASSGKCSISRDFHHSATATGLTLALPELRLWCKARLGPYRAPTSLVMLEVLVMS